MWQDNKSLVIIASDSDPTVMDSLSRKHKDGSSHIYPCPSAIAEYKKMGGVDNNDQLRGYYHVHLKCLKYYKYILWFMFDLVVTVSFFAVTSLIFHTNP